MPDNTGPGEQVLPAVPQAGVCMHITSLPGAYGIGEIGEAALAFIDSMIGMNLRVWQFLPTGPTAYGDSPYQPLSTFAGNEMLIDTAALVRSGLLTSGEADSLSGMPARSVDYGALIPKKNALLERAAGRFHAQANSELKAAYDRFVDRHERDWLNDYALFRILKAFHGERPWPAWEPSFVHREHAALRALAAKHGRAIESIMIIQFLFQHQWERLRAYAAERGVLLFGDMPIYVALDSSDTWADRDIACLDGDGRPSRVAGVPPDYFSEDGQLWGNPLYDWDRHAATDYAWWIKRLKRSIELADLVRIDHFRGFEAYWSIPFGAATARVGEWVRGPGTAIFDAMRSAVGRLPIVAEDLGVITPAVEDLRNRYRMPGMKVLQFEVCRPDFHIDDVEVNCVCYTGTHDNDTTIGWFGGSANDVRTNDEILRTQRAALAATGGDPATIHDDLIRLAYSSRAGLAIAPMQDYLGLGPECRLNTPGTSANNWRWRASASQPMRARMDAIGNMVAEAGRSLAV